jgi:lysozyme
MERITDAEARALFVGDLEEAKDVVARLFTFSPCQCGHQVCEADRVRWRALVNMAFNLGPTRLSGFKKFIAAFNARDWDGAVIEMLDSKWAKQVGERSSRLAKMVRTGEAPCA